MDKTQSEQIAALAAALAKAQGQMTHASKDAANPHFKSRYADLAAVWGAIRGPLSGNGLAVVQTVTQGDGTVGVRSILMHASGEWIASDLHMPVPQKTPQGYGSALTYARRYALAALVGIAQDDDDAEAASRAPASAAIKLRASYGTAPAPAPEAEKVTVHPLPELTPENGFTYSASAAAEGEPGPVERVLVAISEAQTAEDLRPVTQLVQRLGVAKVPEVRKAFAERQKALKSGGAA